MHAGPNEITGADAGGDFNSSPREQAYQIIAAQLRDSWLEKYPGGVGMLHSRLRPHGHASGWRDSSSGQVSDSGDTITVPDRIDHIFVSKPIRVLESYFLPAPDSQTDHPAHWSVVTWHQVLSFPMSQNLMRGGIRLAFSSCFLGRQLFNWIV